MQVGQSFTPYRIFTGPIIPECLIPYDKISWGAKILLAMINRYIGKHENAWPGQEVLAVEMGVSVRSVGAYISELSDDGFIEIDRRGLGKTNRYRAIWHPVFDEPDSDPSQQKPADPYMQVDSDPLRLSYEESQKARESISESTQEASDETATPQRARLIWERIGGKLTRKNRARILTAEICGSASELENEIQGIREWCEDHSHQDPVGLFLRRHSERTGGGTTPRRTPSAHTAPVVDSRRRDFVSSSPAVQESQRGPIVDLLAIWNREVPAAMCPKDSYTPWKEMAVCMENPDFSVEKFTEAAKIGQRILVQRGPEAGWINFRWALTRVGGKAPGWHRLLNELPYMAEPPKPAIKETEPARLHREILERNARNAAAREAAKNLKSDMGVITSATQ